MLKLFSLCIITLIGTQLHAMLPNLFIINDTKSEITLKGTSIAPITIIGQEKFSIKVKVKGEAEIPTPSFLRELHIEKNGKPLDLHILEQVKNQVELAGKDNHLDIYLTISEYRGGYNLAFERRQKHELEERYEDIPDLPSAAIPPSA